MGFDLKAFQAAQYKAREEEIELSGLAAYFPEGERPVFKVRGLTSEELARADEAANRDQLAGELMSKLVGDNKQKAQAMLAAAGIGSDDVPGALRKSLEHVCTGLVEPRLELSDVVKLADSHPVEFRQLSTKVLGLTGLGQVAEVKRRPSGKAPKSEQA